MQTAFRNRAAWLVAAATIFAAGSAVAQETRTLRFTAASNKGHPQVQGVERFAAIVGEKSSGKLKVQMFPGGTLGPDLQVVSAMQGGTVDLNVMNASLLAGNVKEMALLDFPYLFNSAQEADTILDGPVGRKLMDKLPERGLIGLSKRTWDKLSPADQTILREAAVETTTYQRKVAREQAARVLDSARKAGMTVYELPPAELAKLRDLAKPVIAKHTKSVGEEMVNDVNAELARIRTARN